MKKYLVLPNIVFIICFLNQIGAPQSSNDSDVKQYEIGLQFTFLRRADANAANVIFQRYFPSLTDPGPAAVSEFGLGGRFTYNFTRNVAVEAEVNFFPDDKRANPIIGVPIRIAEPGGRKFKQSWGRKSVLEKTNSVYLQK